MSLSDLRNEYHKEICKRIIRISGTKPGYPNFADKGSKSSKEIAWNIVHQLGCKENRGKIVGQTTGTEFEKVTNDFLESAFNKLQHIRPGNWHYATERDISSFDQYKHLKIISKLRKENKELTVYISEEYIVKPDIVIGREKVTTNQLNSAGELIRKTENNIASLTSLRATSDDDELILHASISCKWTIRSDRTQNTRLEALNLIRNRKGNLPHIVAVTAEPLPTRIASLALGTGDLDCVYHFALYELKKALEELDKEDQLDMLNTLIEGDRLRDISDLPLDLAV
jgi:hypothetical protein